MSGERREVDLNALVDEALNLAYHGARAQNASFTLSCAILLLPDDKTKLADHSAGCLGPCHGVRRAPAFMDRTQDFQSQAVRRGLSAGGNRIQTIGPPDKRRWFSFDLSGLFPEKPKVRNPVPFKAVIGWSVL